MDLNDGVFYNETPIMNALAEFKDRPVRTRDVAKAKALLAEAGYPNGVSVPLYYASDHPFSKELAQTVKELASEGGFTIELKGYTRDVYLSQYWLNVPLSITGWGGRIDPSMLLSLAFKGGAPWNESHLNNPQINALINKISTEPNADVRTGYYHQLQDVFYEDGPLINVQVPYLVAINKRVDGYRQPLTMLPQYKYMDVR
jgi:peptide/nickel transport system substrate-binding protein